MCAELLHQKRRKFVMFASVLFLCSYMMFILNEFYSLISIRMLLIPCVIIIIYTLSRPAQAFQVSETGMVISRMP